ncbi:Undecaprenyl-diphosphatase [Pseudidiomarina planktonica]|uniref:Undecaprenyl-diphosphatase n=2 Tax=Pseudidiomarina planktonica TaxID=1323738 RepID=A0A1Y6FY14_9GAMM|nr:undecaprenyl-diphosphate phosphatase [Pseudidiomarina planktonica]RUO62907.1 undecaprenyl-diphosphate phosphatase [Pseudidiomarina planktonica]SMQ80797.1 Undecaprenyl-diphosphatase [Pseudidiomarina planktonica]
MSMLETALLAIIQGLTEFLPISSSAHLILPSQLLGWQDQGLAFDVVVHLGTLLAVVTYFRAQVADLLVGWLGSFRGQHNEHSRLAWLIIWATIPAALFGLLAASSIEQYGRSALVIAVTTILFGLLLWWADCRASERQNMSQLTLKQAIIVGLAQALALIPGTSRSGITMTAGLFLGLKRTDAARFSFLLSIPVILMAGGYQTLKLVQSPVAVDWLALGTGLVLAFVSAYLCIHFFLKIIERMGMLPFVIYRLLLGTVLLLFVFW